MMPSAIWLFVVLAPAGVTSWYLTSVRDMQDKQNMLLIMVIELLKTQIM